jgi:multidrug transporter EmrE-like cation transporter
LKWVTVAAFMALAVSLGAVGQMNLKHGMQKFGDLGTPGLGLVIAVLRAALTPHVLLGLVLYAVSAGLWLVVISPGGWALSYAYPMIAVNYVAVVLLSRALFREAVMPMQWLGIVMICLGVFLVGTFGAARGATP